MSFRLSATFPNALKQTLPRLEGLADRLASPDGAVLDVGVGVGAIAIAMARVWPRLRVVGIDPWRPSLAIARDNVQMAGMGARIEFAIQNPGPDALTAALARLRTVLWGGYPWTAPEAESLLRQAGYTQVQTLPSGPTAPGVRIIGRRSLEEAGA